MKRLFCSLGLIAMGMLAGCGGEKAAAPEPAVQKQPTVIGTFADNPVKRGEYLVRIGSCNDCHTPWVFDEKLGMPVPDMTRMLSGHPSDGPDPKGDLAKGDIAVIGPDFTSFKLPFGTIYTANLTPDKESGLGSWTEQMFIDALRHGRHMGGNGRGIMPPMPWFWARNMSDEDLKAVFAYLQTIPPVYNVVPSNKVPEQALDGLRAGFDQFADMLPHEEWVPTHEQPAPPAEPAAEGEASSQ